MKKRIQEITKYFCISLVSKQEYEAAQVANGNATIAKIIIIIGLIFLAGYLLHRFWDHRKVILICIIIFTFISTGLYALKATQLENLKTQDVTPVRNNAISTQLEDHVTISCGENLYKEWWQL